MNICSNYFLEIENFVEWLVNCKEVLEMGLLKRIQESNKAGLDFMKEHPMVTGVYGSTLFDRVIDHETKPYVYEGKKQGYAEASDEYEKKLLTQAEEFIKQKKDFQMERDAYEALLDEYEIEIDKLNSKLNKSEDEKEYLYQLMLKERELKKLGK